MISQAELELFIAELKLKSNMVQLKKSCANQFLAMQAYIKKSTPSFFLAKKMNNETEVIALEEAMNTVLRAESSEKIVQALLQLRNKQQDHRGIQKILNDFKIKAEVLHQDEIALHAQLEQIKLSPQALDVKKALIEYQEAHQKYVLLAGLHVAKEEAFLHLEKNYHILQQMLGTSRCNELLTKLELASPEIAQEFYKIKELSIKELDHAAMHFELQAKKQEWLFAYNAMLQVRDLAKIFCLLSVCSTYEGRNRKAGHMHAIRHEVLGVESPHTLKLVLEKLNPHSADVGEMSHSDTINKLKSTLLPPTEHVAFLYANTPSLERVASKISARS